MTPNPKPTPTLPFGLSWENLTLVPTSTGGVEVPGTSPLVPHDELADWLGHHLVSSPSSLRVYIAVNSGFRAYGLTPKEAHEHLEALQAALHGADEPARQEARDYATAQEVDPGGRLWMAGQVLARLETLLGSPNVSSVTFQLRPMPNGRACAVISAKGAGDREDSWLECPYNYTSTKLHDLAATFALGQLQSGLDGERFKAPAPPAS